MLEIGNKHFSTPSNDLKDCPTLFMSMWEPTNSILSQYFLRMEAVPVPMHAIFFFPRTNPFSKNDFTLFFEVKNIQSVSG
jgi:hypothetical protein